ncbi:peptidase inhibitor family I36 protein [Amycolatopsis solani]|uniref:peptidase inhibitor family I36 protein n=1 Tax=Amycolatopsis solani TaxID=3028615 RepID=UPI0025B01881|nr:peptidase inhibitor family I36 protein [Amycolatopsis sp. MEP2-6]
MTRAGIVLGTLALAVGVAAGPAAAAPAPPAPTTSHDSAVGQGKAPSPVKKRGDATTNVSPGNGVCEVFEFCLFRLSGFQGSMVDIFRNVPNYAGVLYFVWAPGVGEPIANNSQSAFNGDPDYFVITCTDPGYSGQCGYIPPINGGDFLPDFFLNVESHYFT